jgi:hypothetical protein
MARKRFTPEQVITMLREAEVLLSQSNPKIEQSLLVLKKPVSSIVLIMGTRGIDSLAG